MNSLLRNSIRKVLCGGGICAIAFACGSLLSAAHAEESAVQTEESDALLKAHPGWVHIPGAVIRAECVHEIPAGATVEENGDITVAGQVVAHYEDCPEAPVKTHVRNASSGAVPSPTGNGWVEDIEMTVALAKGDSIDRIDGKWSVPKAPLLNGGVVFIFNGIEPSAGNIILQPVLQYGAAGGSSVEGPLGGNYWLIASWMVGKNAYHSPGVKVASGDVIYGNTYVKSESSGKLSWSSVAKDETSGKSSDLNVWSSGIQWDWAFEGVLEAYNIKSCSELPVTTHDEFTANAVYHGYPKFEPVADKWHGVFDDYFGHGGPACGYRQIVDGDIGFLYW
jgi:hypothetical protein